MYMGGPIGNSGPREHYNWLPVAGYGGWISGWSSVAS